MHKSSSELDQAFVESVARGVPPCEPKLLKHIMRFIKELLVEALEITEVVRIVRFALAGCDQRGDFFGFPAQLPKLTCSRLKVQSFHFDKLLPLRHIREMAKPALGRGLGALLGGVPAKPAPLPAANFEAPSEAIPASATVRQVPLDQVRPCPFQPRKDFNAEALAELAESIRQQGIIQPLVVRQSGNHLELIAGERRWRAAALAGMKEVPVIIRAADDRSALELALIENLQRENLNPLEEALGYSELIEKFNLRQEDVAAKVGKSRTVVANALRLLKLDRELQDYLRDGRLSVGHAKVILGLSNHGHQRLAAERALKENLSVRQMEELVSRLQNQKSSGGSENAKTVPGRSLDPHVGEVENRLRERLGTKVQLRYRQGKGLVEIRFFNDQELERILEILGVKVE